MSLVVPEVSQSYFLGLILANTVKLKLYSNNIVPSFSDILGTYTEVIGGGYTPISLAPGDWTVSLANPSSATQAPANFVFTGPTGGPGTVYGYYMTTSDDLTLLWTERFVTTPVTPVLNTLIRIIPLLKLGYV